MLRWFATFSYRLILQYQINDKLEKNKKYENIGILQRIMFQID